MRGLGLHLSLGSRVQTGPRPAPSPSIVLSANTISEDAGIGDLVGTLSVPNHPSGSSGWSFSIDSQTPTGALTLGAAPTIPDPPAGDDIFIIMSDSLGTGIGGGKEEDRDPILDAPVAGTSQYVNHSSQPDYQSLRTSTAPTWHVGGLYSPSALNGRISVLEPMLRQYQSLTAARGRGATVIGCGRGGTNLIDTASNNDWDAAGPGAYIVDAKTTFNAARAQVLAIKPHSRVRGIIIALTSNDAGPSAATYNSTNIRAAWIAAIDYARANFNGVTDETVFILCGPCAVGSATFTAARADVAYAAAQRALAYNVNPVTPTANPDNLHPTLAETRTWGTNIANAIYAAPEPSVVENFTIDPVNGAALSTPIESDVFIPMLGFGQTAAITVSGLEYRLDGGSWTSAPGTYRWGNEIEVRKTSSGSYTTTVSGSITVGTKSATFNVTTAALGGTTNVVSLSRGACYSNNGKFIFVDEGLLLESV